MALVFRYFRPEWTCGRYNSEKKAAIIYNLIEGMAYFFEDTSADIVGSILSANRNQCVDFGSFLDEKSISEEMLDSFLKQLCKLSLITESEPSKDRICSYRRGVAQWKRNKLSTENKTTQEKLPFKKDDAEVSYLRKVGGITQAMFELTYRCSEKCIHCYNIGATRNDSEESHRASVKELSILDYKRVIDQLYYEGCFKIALSGGDPFSKTEIWEIIAYLYEKNIAFDIYTNCQGLVGKVKKLIDYYPRLMSISLYADNACDHDYITRIPGSWDKTVNTMYELGDYAVPMDIKVCIMRSNIKSYRGVIDIARKAGGMALFEASINDSVDGDKCVSKFLRLTPEEYDIILRDDNIGLYVGKEAPDYGKQAHNLDKPMCEGGQAAICIDPQGNVMPCSAFHLEFGNVNTQSIHEIIQSSPILKEWSVSKLSDCEECMTHDYCDYCILCPGKAFAEHGTWRKAAENCCYIAKLRYSMAERLKRGDDPLKGKSIEVALSELPDYSHIPLYRVKS